MNNQHAARLRKEAWVRIPELAAPFVAGADALEAVEVAKAALRGLVTALEEVHEDPYYQRVWNLHQLHCGPYKGKKYEAELKQAHAALARLEGK